MFGLGNFFIWSVTFAGYNFLKVQNRAVPPPQGNYSKSGDNHQQKGGVFKILGSFNTLKFTLDIFELQIRSKKVKTKGGVLKKEFGKPCFRLNLNIFLNTFKIKLSTKNKVPNYLCNTLKLFYIMFIFFSQLYFLYLTA